MEGSSLSSVAVPALPTPDTFDFPYPKPYDIQFQLMQAVFRAIEDRKIAIVRLALLYSKMA